MKKGYRLTLFMLSVGIFFLIVCSANLGAKEKKQEEQGESIPKLFVPRSPSTENFSCTKCHLYRAADRNKRVLKEYHVSIELKHAEEQRWCYDCHEGDKLRLQNGRLVGFDTSYYLCGQCHGTIFRDWKAGIHGKRTGMWNGEKQYRLCVSCHDPHSPRFKPLEPKQAPMMPKEIKG